MRVSTRIIWLVAVLAVCRPSNAADDSRALTLSIAEDGMCKVSVGEQAATGDSGKTVEIKGLAGAQVRRLENGQHVVSYDFAKFQNADNLKPALLSSDPQKAKEFDAQISVDKEEGVLVLTPGPKQRTQLPFPRQLKIPVEISVGVRAFSGKILMLQCSMGTGVLVASLHGEGSPEAPTGFVTVGWRPENKSFQQLLKFKPMGAGTKQEFQLPDGDWSGRVGLSIGVLADLPIAVERIDVVGTIPPAFGAQLDDRSSGVVVVRTVEGSAAAKAGIKPGDVLISVNGAAVKSAKQALEALGAAGLGEETEWTVKRFGRTQSLKVVAE